MRRSLMLLLAVPLATAVAGCGGSSDGVSVESYATAPTDTTAPVTAEAVPPPNVAKAIAAAKAEKPDVPAWREAKFSGVVFSDTEVCVTQVLAIDGKPMPSHVIVSWPDLYVGEPLDGKCGKSPQAEANAAAAKADKDTETKRAFYLAMDDLAVQLDEAIRRAQDGNAAGVAKVSALRDEIKSRNDKYLRDTAEMSTGGNQLQSAATKARDAAEYGDVAVMARARADIVEARSTLADEGMGG